MADPRAAIAMPLHSHRRLSRLFRAFSGESASALNDIECMRSSSQQDEGWRRGTRAAQGQLRCGDVDLTRRKTGYSRQRTGGDIA